jgi:3-oxoacyl-[acyl-carrier protein] reductase
MSIPGTALVTGASRGLGAAIARRLAVQGHPVAVNYHASTRAAEAVRDDIRARGGVAEIVRADATDPVQIARMCQEVTGTLGETDVLVLNATGPQPSLPIDAVDRGAMLAQLEFFVLGPLALTQAVLPAMRRKRSGRIIFIGSEVVDLGVPHSSAYVAAKAAQVGLARSWARELGPDNVTVNLVAPGFVPTERHRDVPQQDVDACAEGVPLRRLGEPVDIADAVAFLASPAARFITGQRLAVNGGNTLL